MRGELVIDAQPAFLGEHQDGSRGEGFGDRLDLKDGVRLRGDAEFDVGQAKPARVGQTTMLGDVKGEAGNWLLGHLVPDVIFDFFTACGVRQQQGQAEGCGGGKVHPRKSRMPAAKAKIYLTCAKPDLCRNERMRKATY